KDEAFIRNDPKFLKEETREISVAVVATNATTGTYTTVESSLPGEAAPVGLAQFLYDATSELHWEGSLSMIEDEVGGTAPGLGQVLNLTNGHPAWATMR